MAKYKKLLFTTKVGRDIMIAIYASHYLLTILYSVNYKCKKRHSSLQKKQQKNLHSNYSQLFNKSLEIVCFQLQFKRFWLKQMKKLRLNGFTEGRSYLIWGTKTEPCYTNTDKFGWRFVKCLVWKYPYEKSQSEKYINVECIEHFEFLLSWSFRLICFFMQ